MIKSSANAPQAKTYSSTTVTDVNEQSNIEHDKFIHSYERI